MLDFSRQRFLWCFPLSYKVADIQKLTADIYTPAVEQSRYKGSSKRVEPNIIIGRTRLFMDVFRVWLKCPVISPESDGSMISLLCDVTFNCIFNSQFASNRKPMRGHFKQDLSLIAGSQTQTGPETNEVCWYSRWWTLDF